MSEPIVFNPNNVARESLPAIYCFSNVVGGGDGEALAIADSGHLLGSHWCSHEAYVRGDLGVIEGWRSDRHEGYRKHYPDGYRMVFIPSREVKEHEGLKRAFEKNQTLETEKPGTGKSDGSFSSVTIEVGE